MDSFFAGKTALVTGSTSGLGLAIARRLGKIHGCCLILVGRNLECLRSLGSELNAECVVLDLRKGHEFIEAALSSHKGKIDVLVNCAGQGCRGLASETTNGCLSDIMELNFFAQISTWKSLQPAHLIQISSVQGFFGRKNRSAYAAAKHALHGFFDSVRAEGSYLDRPCRVSMVCPGWMKTKHSASALTAAGRAYGITDAAYSSLGLSPEVVAEKALTDISRGQDEVIICSLKIRLLIILRHLWPSLAFYLLRNEKQD